MDKFNYRKKSVALYKINKLLLLEWILNDRDSIIKWLKYLSGLNNKLFINIIKYILKKRKEKIALGKNLILKTYYYYLGKIIKYNLNFSNYKLIIYDKEKLMYITKNNKIYKINKNTIRFISKNHKFKQKLIYKKYWYLWKLNNFNSLKLQIKFFWPLIMIIKPYTIIIKNIYFKKHFILKKKKDYLDINNLSTYINDYKINLIFLLNSLSKYVNLSKYNTNYNYNLKKDYILNSSIYKFSKIKKIFSNYRVKLIYLKFYKLFFFWFIYFSNNIIIKINNFLFKLWINLIYINLYNKINNKIYFIIRNLYKNKCSLNRSRINEYRYLYYIYFFKNITSIIEYNLLDLLNLKDMYKYNDYYKDAYFLIKKNILLNYKNNNILLN